MGTQRLQSIPFSIPANGQLQLNITGSFLVIEEASQSSFDLALDYDTPVPFDKGIIYQTPEGDPFQAVTLYDRSGAGLTGVIKFGLGNYRDGRVYIAGGIEVSNAVRQAGAPVVRCSVDKACPPGQDGIMGVDLNRREILLTNLDAATTLRIGCAAVNATTGQPLPPGATLVLSTTSDLYAYNPSAANVMISRTEILNA